MFLVCYAARMRETASNLETIFDTYPFALMLTRQWAREEMDELLIGLCGLLGPRVSQDAGGRWEFFGSVFLFHEQEDALIAKLLVGGDLCDMKKLLAGIDSGIPSSTVIE